VFIKNEKTVLPGIAKCVSLWYKAGQGTHGKEDCGRAFSGLMKKGPDAGHCGRASPCSATKESSDSVVTALHDESRVKRMTPYDSACQQAQILLFGFEQ
jgi:hypothetical protein